MAAPLVDQQLTQQTEELTIASSSSAKQSAEPIRSNQNASPTFLSLPRDLRDEIYRYFVTLDPSLEMVPGRPLGSIFNIKIFLLNRQIRLEALQIARLRNLWIVICCPHTHRARWAPFLKHMLLNTPQLYTKSQCPALTLMCKMSPDMTVCVASTYGCPEIQSDNAAWDVFPFHRRTFSEFCVSLWTHAAAYGNELSISIQGKIHTKPQNMTKVIGPLKTIRGLRSVFIQGLGEEATIDLKRAMESSIHSWEEARDHLMPVMKAAEEAFGRQDFLEAMHHSRLGSLMFRRLLSVGESQRFSNTDAHEFHKNGFCSFGVDITCNIVEASNALVYKRGLAAVHEEQLYSAVTAADRAISVFPGISSFQRLRVYCHWSEALRHLARFQESRGLVHAAEATWNAAAAVACHMLRIIRHRLGIHNEMRRFQSIPKFPDRVSKMFQEIPTQFIHVNPGTWVGDPRLFRREEWRWFALQAPGADDNPAAVLRYWLKRPEEVRWGPIRISPDVRRYEPEHQYRW